MESAADADTPSPDTLQRAPARALSLLLGVGRAPHIWAHLSTRGYTAAEHATGWKLLRATDPSAAVDPAAPARQNDAAVQDALAQLDAWDNENLPIASVALRRREPEVHAYLFAHGLKHADGAASVRVVGIFLDRVDGVRAVAEGRSKEDVSFDRSQARKALALLHSRGLTDAALGDVRAWLKTVQRGAEPTAAATAAAPAPDTTAALLALYEWVDEWSQVARRVVKRRADLIQLGLAEKKARKTKGVETPKPV